MTAVRGALAASPRERIAAVGVGCAAALAAGIDLVRWMRPGVLLDPDPSWAAARLLLALGVAAGAAAAGAAAAALFLAWARSRAATQPLGPVALRHATLVAVTLAAIIVGAALRFYDLARIPEPMWVDDLSIIQPALALSGGRHDFADSIRAVPYGVAKPYGTIGVLYLEGYRAALRLCGTTVYGVRLPSALAGAASLVTAALLGRALLPAGGGMLTASTLAGLRWQLILSRWGFNMIVLAPIVDVATLVLVAARRRGSAALAVAAGAVAGIGAHVYLSAWPAAAALALFALWPAVEGERSRARVALAAAFVLGFALCAAPLFFLREGRAAPYFARTADHNVALEMRREHSLLPPFAAAADALASPWFLADPTPRHDLPGRSRLGWLLGVPVAIAFGRSLLRPREPVSGLLLAQAAAAFAAVVAGGQADNPNGARFGYLSSLTAVAAAAGLLWLVGLAPGPLRRAAAVAVLGALAVGGALSARDALLRWPRLESTFDGFHGQDTLIGRAAARWSRYGAVVVDPGIVHSPLAAEAVLRYGLDPDAMASQRPNGPADRRFRVARLPAARGRERVVEIVRDDWGRDWAAVLGTPAGRS